MIFKYLNEDYDLVNRSNIHPSLYRELSSLNLPDTEMRLHNGVEFSLHSTLPEFDEGLLLAYKTRGEIIVYSDKGVIKFKEYDSWKSIREQERYAPGYNILLRIIFNGTIAEFICARQKFIFDFTPISVDRKVGVTMDYWIDNIAAVKLISSEPYDSTEELSNVPQDTTPAFLTEDIASVKKNYPNISDEDFDRLIRLDPTFKDGKDSVGTYGKWILTLFNKGKLTNEGHVFDVLSRFEQEKKNLKNKDIGRFKSIEEVDEYLNDDDSYKELSHRQEVRGRQKDRKNADLGNEAEKVFETSEWEVWVPKTYAASCKLGQGSSWCTASTESDYYYKHYTNSGNLYININKTDPEEKYQFHFESSSFMDINDRSIYIMEFLEDKPALKEFYLPKLLEVIGLDESDIDEDGHVTATVYDESDFESVFGRDWGSFIYNLINGDSYECFNTDYWYSSFSVDFIPSFDEFPDNLKRALSVFGINCTDDIINVIEENEELDQAFRLAYEHACIEGAMAEALDDLQDALDDFNATIKDTEIYFYYTVEDILNSAFYEDCNHYEDIIFEEVRENFNFVEPQYGWDGFDTMCFYEELMNRLGEIEE